jgi:hypothetical protein
VRGGRRLPILTAFQLRRRLLTDRRPSEIGMAWFARRKSARFPPDMLARMDRFARYTLDPRSSGIDGTRIWEPSVGEFRDDFKADPDGFLIDLRVLTETDQGGFATYGAACLVWELLNDDALTTPLALPLIDSGIDFKIARGSGMNAQEVQRFQARQPEPS